MKYLSQCLVLLVSVLLFAACSHKVVNSKEGYVGYWKVTDPQLGVYYITLNADGNGSSTRDGGELGRWSFIQDHIELEWMPKNMAFYFNSGQAKPMKNPSVESNSAYTAEKVEKLPQ